MNTKTVSETDIHDSVLQSLSDIDKLILDSDIMISKSVISKSSVQKLIFHSSHSKIKENIVKKLILDAAFKSEMKSAGAGDLCLKIYSSIIRNMIMLRKSGKSNREIIEIYKDKFKPLEQSILKNSSKFKYKDFQTLVDSRFKTDIEKEILKNIIDNFNIKSSIFMEKSHQEETTISYYSGFDFKISVSQDFILEKKSWKEKNVNCLVIDGMIESVGEIHHLLEKASNTKEPYVLFVRSVSEDVKRTVCLNLKRRTINLILVEVGFDENTLNIMNDIAVACDTDVVSSYKGDLISSSVKKDMKIVKEIEILKDSVVIVNKPDKDLLNSHIKYLKSKRDACYETRFIYENRLKSLSSGKTVLKIGNNLLLKNKDMIENFDNFFREIRSYIMYGSLSFSDLIFEDLEDVENIFKEYEIISPLSAFIASKSAISLSSSILSIGKGIISDS